MQPRWRAPSCRSVIRGPNRRCLWSSDPWHPMARYPPQRHAATDASTRGAGGRKFAASLEGPEPAGLGRAHRRPGVSPIVPTIRRSARLWLHYAGDAFSAANSPRERISRRVSKVAPVLAPHDDERAPTRSPRPNIRCTLNRFQPGSALHQPGARVPHIDHRSSTLFSQIPRGSDFHVARHRAWTRPWSGRGGGRSGPRGGAAMADPRRAARDQPLRLALVSRS